MGQRHLANCSRRTSEPTETASSTSAVSSWGVETETSTPQLSLKSHWFFELLTRATTRGTANSCLASSEIDQVVLVVAGGGHHHVDVGDAGRSREDTSQASAATQVTPRRRAQPLDQLGVLLEDHHVVAVGVQVLRDGGADAAGAGDHDPHVPRSRRVPSARARASSSSRSASSSTARCSTSPSWPTSSAASRRGCRRG